MRVAMRTVLLLALATLSCGDNLDPISATSGSRLKLGRYLYSDGVTQVETRWFFDAGRRERCSSLRWSDGATYCTPVADPAVYVDDRCGASLGRVPLGATPADYFVSFYAVRGEPRASRLHRAGGPVAAPAGTWELRDGACIGPSAAEPVYDYYAVGEELVATDFVRIRSTVRLASAPYSVEYLTTGDGLHAPSSRLSHPTYGLCGVAAAANEPTTTCAPSDAEVISYFRDDACTELALHRRTDSLFAYRDDAVTSCRRFYWVGDEVDAVPLYERVGDVCIETVSPDGARVYAAGTALDLAPITREPRGAGRLQTIALGDLPIEDALLHDAELGADCRRDEADLRCIPTTATTMAWFADAGCQQPLALALVPVGACDTPVAFARRGDDIVPILTPYTAPIYELSTGDRCDPIAPPARFVAHAIGEALPRDMFPAASLVIDP